MARLRADLDALVAAAIRACDAHRMTGRTLAAHAGTFHPDIPFDVVAAGKAAGPMLRAFEEAYPSRVRSTVIASPSTGAGHPEPNETSIAYGRRALALAANARSADQPLVVLLSGGASALLAAPSDGITLDDKVAATRALLHSGLPIAAMNAVRRHISAIKGGRLAAAAGRSITLAISDVHSPVEDDPAAIGSGPTVADPSTFDEALRALADARVLGDMPDAVRHHLERGAAGEREETIKPGDPRLANSQYVIAGTRHDAMDGVVEAARLRDYRVHRIAAPTLGQAADAARRFVAGIRDRFASSPDPLCVVASGETTVKLGESPGLGGRNQEFALAAASDIASLDASALASIGTDGIDGPTDAAGAIVDSTTVARAAALGLDPVASLRRHDAYPFFRALGDLVMTGPTGTNVGDVQIFLWRR